MVASPLVGQRSDALALPPHPAAVVDGELATWAAEQTVAGRPIAIDLFSGAGGLSAGIEAAGWAVAAAVDHDARALETHRHNFPGLALDLDLGETQAREAFVQRLAGIEIDLVAGGPPCQPFSRAGRSKIRSLVDAGVRDATDLRKELWQAFLDVAVRLSPRAILMENVPDMGLGDDFAVIRQMVDRLESLGYATQVRLADAWQYGVPQHRKRLILLARNDGREFVWPVPVENITKLREAIWDLPRLGEGTGARSLPYEVPDDQSPFASRMRLNARPGVIHDQMTRGVRDDDREIFQLMSSKTLYSDIPAKLRRYSAHSFTDKYKRLDWGELSRSITAHIAKDGYWYIHPEEHRTLTVREAARIQTFPDNFRFAGTRSDAFRQIGNAVPPLLGEAAARAVRAETPPVATGSAGAWLQVRSSLAEWAKEKQATEYWFMLPGPDMTPPAALAAAVLSGHQYNHREVALALAEFRGLSYFNHAQLNRALDALSVKAKLALARLLPLARKRKIWTQDPDGVPSIIRLSDSEHRIYDLLRGKDLLLRSQGVLRVAARALGTRSHETNRLTEGRMDLARLVGSGPEAPSRMAAIRLLATTGCGISPHEPARCPLAGRCGTTNAEPEALAS